MSISLLLMKQILSLVLMGAAGYILRKKGLLSQEGSRGLTVVCIYLCVPCALFNSIQTQTAVNHMSGFVYAMTAVAVLHSMFFLVMYGIRKVWPLSGIESASIIYSNSGNLIIPLVAGAFGNEYVFYTSAYLLIQNTLLWTHGLSCVAGKRGSSLKQVFLHPCLLGLGSGFLFLSLGWSLPEVADIAFQGLGSCLGPISMLIVGSLMAELDLKQIFCNLRAYGIVFLRLLVYPLLAAVTAFLIWYFFPLETDPVIFLIVVLGSSGPSATTLTQMAQMYDKEAGYASMLNALTTFGSVVTIPLVAAVAQGLLNLG